MITILLYLKKKQKQNTAHVFLYLLQLPNISNNFYTKVQSFSKPSMRERIPTNIEFSHSQVKTCCKYPCLRGVQRRREEAKTKKKKKKKKKMARAIRVRIYYTKAGVASCVRTSPRSLKSFYILAARVVYIVHNGLSLLLRGRATSMTTMLAFLVLGYACAMASCAHSPQQTLPHFFGVILSR